MEIKKFFSKGGNLVFMVVLLLLAVDVVALIVGDVNRLQAATTKSDYYQNLIYLIVDIARTYFFSIYLLMVDLTYSHKQYSQWSIRLFYLLGISALLYFYWAGTFSESVFNNIEAQNIENYPKMVRRLFTGPVFSIIVGYLFTPKILKDAQKLKEEQDLTI